MKFRKCREIRVGDLRSFVSMPNNDVDVLEMYGASGVIDWLYAVVEIGEHPTQRSFGRIHIVFFSPKLRRMRFSYIARDVAEHPVLVRGQQ